MVSAFTRPGWQEGTLNVGPGRLLNALGAASVWSRQSVIDSPPSHEIIRHSKPARSAFEAPFYHNQQHRNVRAPRRSADTGSQCCDLPRTAPIDPEILRSVD